MVRISASICVMVLLTACSRKPAIEVADQLLTWPALDSVTDIRIHLVHDGDRYLLASGKSLFSIRDTSLSATPELLYSFHDSLWDYYVPLRHPGDSLRKPRDMTNSYFSGMSDFYIRCIQHIDKENLLVILAFNSVSITPASNNVNLDRLLFVFNKKTGEVKFFDAMSYFTGRIGQDTLLCTLDNNIPIKAVTHPKGSFLFSASCSHYVGNNTVQPSPEILGFDTYSLKERFFFPEKVRKTESAGDDLITKDLRIYSVYGESVALLAELDSTQNAGKSLRDASIFPDAQNMVLLKTVWSGTENFTVQLYYLKGRSEEVLFHEVKNVTLPGRILYPAKDGHLLYFYEKDALVHQITISAP